MASIGSFGRRSSGDASAGRAMWWNTATAAAVVPASQAEADEEGAGLVEGGGEGAVDEDPDGAVARHEPGP